MKEVDDFLLYLSAEKGLSLHTLAAYGSDLKQFIRFLQGISVVTVTSSDLIAYFEQMKKRGVASSSLCRALIAVKVFFRFLKRENVIQDNPAFLLETPKVWELIPEVMTEEEVRRFLDVPSSADFIGARDRALFHVMYAAGLRVSEVCQLNIEDLSDDVVRVKGKGSKERIVPIAPIAIQAVDDFLLHFREGSQEPALFVTKRHTRISRFTVWAQMKHYAKKAGIDKTVSPHTLRHSFATHIFENGADLRVVQELLGHENIGTTDCYTHISSKHLKEMFAKHHPKFS